jgi:hypothetical protein
MAFNRYQHLPSVADVYGKPPEPEDPLKRARKYFGGEYGAQQQALLEEKPLPDNTFLEWIKQTSGKTGSTVLDILHQLGRPGSAVLGGVKRGGEEWGKEGAYDEGTVPLGMTGFPIPRKVLPAFLSGAKKGFTYEDETRGQDFLSEDFKKNNPISAFSLGFLIDVLSDPLTFGAAKALTVPIEAGAKGLVKLGGKSETLSRLAETASVSQIADALNISIGEAGKIKELSTKFRDQLKGVSIKAERNMMIRNRQLDEIAEKAGISKDELMTAITDDIERGTIGTPDSLTAKISDEAVEYATQDKNIYDELLRLEKEAGISVEDILNRADELGIEGYVPHIATAAARKASTFKGKINDPVSAGSALKRQHEGTIKEINERMSGEYDQMMHTNPALNRAVRESRSAHELAYRGFNDEVTSFGQAAENFPNGKFPKDWVAIKDIEGVRFPPGLAKIIKRQRDVLSNKTMLDDSLKYVDAVQNAWKMWSLGVRPSYHSRNVVGNLWNAYTVAGLKDPRMYDMARRLQLAAFHDINPDVARKLGADSKVIGGLDWGGKVTSKGGVEKTWQEIFDAAVDRGVIGKGQYGVGSDIMFNLERQLERGATRSSGSDVAKSMLSPTESNPILRAGFKVGNVLEDNARLAVFIDQFKKTGSFDKASNMVKKSLFDYSDLSSFEKTVMKRVMPFYTWSRKNIPAQLEALWKNPQRARKLDITRQNIEDLGEGRPDPQNVYDFYNKGVPIYLDKKEKGEVWELYRMLNYLPLADIERMVEPGELMGEMITPIIKHPIEQLSNYDTYRKKKIEEYKGQTSDFLGIRMPVRMAHLAQLLVPVAELDRANPFGMFGEATKNEESGEWTRTKSWGLEQPLVGFEVPKLPGPLGIASGRYELGGTPRETRRDQPAGLRLLQATLGLRPYYVGEGTGRKYAIKNFNKDLRSLKYYLSQADKKNMPKRAGELNELIRQWEVANKKAELAKKEGKRADYTFRGSRYYEK